MEQSSNQPVPAENMAKVAYILYLVSIVFGVTALVAVVIAYVNRDEGPQWLRSHYQFQIRTFWIGLLYLVVGSVLSLVIIGWFMLLFSLVWIIVRCIKGLKLLDSQQAHPEPLSWFF